MLKILEENIGSKISDISCSHIFWCISSGNGNKRKNKTNELYKTKIFCTAKETNKMKRQHTEWENIVANDTSDKGLIPKIYKELLQLITKKSNNPIFKKWAEDLNRHFSQEDT